MELRVTQTAISHQVKSLEQTLGVELFKRLARGIVLTDEGQALVPVLTDGFRRMSAALSQFEDGNFQEILTVGIVSTFAMGWLLPRLPRFQALQPLVDLRIKTNNNRADMLADGLDFFIRFGDGAWHGTEAVPLMATALSPLCAPAIAQRLRHPADLRNEDLLRSYRIDEWPTWFRYAGVRPPALRGWMFDSSLAMVATAARGTGIALVPVAMFTDDIRRGNLVQPFELCANMGSYWLTRLRSRTETSSMAAFRQWVLAEADARTNPA
jgi:LysR family transcriptional regulator of beta-lactamase